MQRCFVYQLFSVDPAFLVPSFRTMLSFLPAHFVLSNMPTPTSTRRISCMMAIDMLFSLYTRHIPRSRNGYYCGILDDTLYFEEGLKKRCDQQAVEGQANSPRTLR